MYKSLKSKKAKNLKRLHEKDKKKIICKFCLSKIDRNWYTREGLNKCPVCQNYLGGTNKNGKQRNEIKWRY